MLCNNPAIISCACFQKISCFDMLLLLSHFTINEKAARLFACESCAGNRASLSNIISLNIFSSCLSTRELRWHPVYILKRKIRQKLPLLNFRSNKDGAPSIIPEILSYNIHNPIIHHTRRCQEYITHKICECLSGIPQDGSIPSNGKSGSHYQ